MGAPVGWAETPGKGLLPVPPVPRLPAQRWRTILRPAPLAPQPASSLPEELLWKQQQQQQRHAPPGGGHDEGADSGAETGGSEYSRVSSSSSELSVEDVQDPFLVSVHIIADPGESNALQKAIDSLLAWIHPDLQLFRVSERRVPQKADKAVASQPALAVILFLQEEFDEEPFLQLHESFQKPPWHYHHTERVHGNFLPYMPGSQDFFSLAQGTPLWAIRPVHYGKEIIRFTIYCRNENFADLMKMYELILKRRVCQKKTDFCVFPVYSNADIDIQLSLKRLPRGHVPSPTDSAVLEFRVKDIGQLVPLLPNPCSPISEGRWQTEDPDGNKILLQVLDNFLKSACGISEILNAYLEQQKIMVWQGHDILIALEPNPMQVYSCIGEVNLTVINGAYTQQTWYKKCVKQNPFCWSSPSRNLPVVPLPNSVPHDSQPGPDRTSDPSKPVPLVTFHHASQCLGISQQDLRNSDQESCPRRLKSALINSGSFQRSKSLACLPTSSSSLAPEPFHFSEPDSLSTLSYRTRTRVHIDDLEGVQETDVDTGMKLAFSDLSVVSAYSVSDGIGSNMERKTKYLTQEQSIDRFKHTFSRERSCSAKCNPFELSTSFLPFDQFSGASVSLSASPSSAHMEIKYLPRGTVFSFGDSRTTGGGKTNEEEFYI